MYLRAAHKSSCFSLGVVWRYSLWFLSCLLLRCRLLLLLLLLLLRARAVVSDKKD